MTDTIEKRACQLAVYMVENGATVRAAASHFGISKSTVHKDLQQRLVQKGEDPVQAAEAVAWMEEMQLVDDGETARQIVSRCIAKGYGLQRAKQALYEKKIPKQYWEEALADYPDQWDRIESFLKSRLDADSDLPSQPYLRSQRSEGCEACGRCPPASGA